MSAAGGGNAAAAAEDKPFAVEDTFSVARESYPRALFSSLAGRILFLLTLSFYLTDGKAAVCVCKSVKE